MFKVYTTDLQLHTSFLIKSSFTTNQIDGMIQKKMDAIFILMRSDIYLTTAL